MPTRPVIPSLHQQAWESPGNTLLLRTLYQEIATALTGLAMTRYFDTFTYKTGSKLARVCDVSRTTAYKYNSLLEAQRPGADLLPVLIYLLIDNFNSCIFDKTIII